MNSKYSVIVIGSGISGIYSALKIAQNTNKKVLLITKFELGESNSYYAQGGMVAVLKSNKEDNVDLHVKDTLVAGAGLSEEVTVRYISENSDKIVQDLLNFGVKFDKDETGYFKLTKEAAHSTRRILHCDGDATGREMEIALVNALKANSKIDIIENAMVTELIVQNNSCTGIKFLKQDKYEVIRANAVVVATGGIGQIYKYTTNPIGATGDGLALCYNAGAILRDLEFVQFHPTALAIDDMKNHNRFLISEAVRGEGAKLCDTNSYYYMKDYDSRQELAPRDIVARSNFAQMKKTNSEFVYLDAREIKNVQDRFPNIYAKCKKSGIDITKDLIPVAPAAHYFMGGVKTNYKGETSVKNLYAIGEVASTGLHGANRLASNSLLECVVCAYTVAQTLKNIDQCSYPDILCCEKPQDNSDYDVDDIKEKLRQTMWDNVGIFRDEKSLIKALNEIETLEIKTGTKINSQPQYELKNMLLVAKLITTSALKRKESRGAHYRTDYLQTGEIGKHSEIKKGDKLC